jgi:hypothetical protein
MDAPMNEVLPARESVLAAIAALLDDQARVVRAEAALAAAKRRMAASELRLGRLQRARGAVLPWSEPKPEATMRSRIIAEMEARREEVFTPARIAAAVGAANRDSVRNTLLVLARKGQIVKVGEGRYRAREKEKEG